MSAATTTRVGVLLIGHGALPAALQAAATHIVGTPSLATHAIGIAADENTDAARARIARAVATLDSGAGVLLLIDALGATPYQLAHAATENRDRIATVTGLNLPMLVRVYNYPEMELAELADSAATAGRRGATRAP
ncbi:PTS sugar transporter subunit IIA [Salinisphaera sp. RV14]|uniref:PTS sugar transporter subunit IIA n=1 Tax=unclassified Salinisphaera TaxID=2649847 RepID=UPI003F8341E3